MTNPFAAVAAGAPAQSNPFTTVGQAPAAPAAAPAPAVTTPVVVPPVAPGTIPAFGHSTESTGTGERHKVRDYLGRPLLIKIRDLGTWTDPQGVEKEIADVDWIVLDPAAPKLCESARIFNAPIVRDLKKSVAEGKQFHVGRVIEVQSKHPQPALALGSVTPEEETLAGQAGQTLGWF